MRFCLPVTLLSLDLKVVADSTFLGAGCEEEGTLGYLVTNFVRTLSPNLVMNLVGDDFSDKICEKFSGSTI